MRRGAGLGEILEGKRLRATAKSYGDRKKRMSPYRHLSLESLLLEADRREREEQRLEHAKPADRGKEERLQKNSGRQRQRRKRRGLNVSSCSSASSSFTSSSSSSLHAPAADGFTSGLGGDGQGEADLWQKDRRIGEGGQTTVKDDNSDHLAVFSENDMSDLLKQMEDPKDRIVRTRQDARALISPLLAPHCSLSSHHTPHPNFAHLRRSSVTPDVPTGGHSAAPPRQQSAKCKIERDPDQNPQGAAASSENKRATDRRGRDGCPDTQALVSANRITLKSGSPSKRVAGVRPFKKLFLFPDGYTSDLGCVEDFRLERATARVVHRKSHPRHPYHHRFHPLRRPAVHNAQMCGLHVHDIAPPRTAPCVVGNLRGTLPGRMRLDSSGSSSKELTSSGASELKNWQTELILPARPSDAGEKRTLAAAVQLPKGRRGSSSSAVVRHQGGQRGGDAARRTLPVEGAEEIEMVTVSYGRGGGEAEAASSAFEVHHTDKDRDRNTHSPEKKGNTEGGEARKVKREYRRGSSSTNEGGGAEGFCSGPEEGVEGEGEEEEEEAVEEGELTFLEDPMGEDTKFCEDFPSLYVPSVAEAGKGGCSLSAWRLLGPAQRMNPLRSNFMFRSKPRWCDEKKQTLLDANLQTDDISKEAQRGTASTSTGLSPPSHPVTLPPSALKGFSKKSALSPSARKCTHEKSGNIPMASDAEGEGEGEGSCRLNGRSRTVKFSFDEPDSPRVEPGLEGEKQEKERYRERIRARRAKKGITRDMVTRIRKVVRVGSRQEGGSSSSSIGTERESTAAAAAAALSGDVVVDHLAAASDEWSEGADEEKEDEKFLSNSDAASSSSSGSSTSLQSFEPSRELSVVSVDINTDHDRGRLSKSEGEEPLFLPSRGVNDQREKDALMKSRRASSYSLIPGGSPAVSLSPVLPMDPVHAAGYRILGRRIAKRRYPYCVSTNTTPHALRPEKAEEVLRPGEIWMENGSERKEESSSTVVGATAERTRWRPVRPTSTKVKEKSKERASGSESRIRLYEYRERTASECLADWEFHSRNLVHLTQKKRAKTSRRGDYDDSNEDEGAGPELPQRNDENSFAGGTGFPLSFTRTDTEREGRNSPLEARRSPGERSQSPLVNKTALADGAEEKTKLEGLDLDSRLASLQVEEAERKRRKAEQEKLEEETLYWWEESGDDSAASEETEGDGHFGSSNLRRSSFNGTFRKASDGGALGVLSQSSFVGPPPSLIDKNTALFASFVCASVSRDTLISKCSALSNVGGGPDPPAVGLRGVANNRLQAGSLREVPTGGNSQRMSSDLQQKGQMTSAVSSAGAAWSARSASIGNALKAAVVQKWKVEPEVLEAFPFNRKDVEKMEQNKQEKEKEEKGQRQAAEEEMERLQKEEMRRKSTPEKRIQAHGNLPSVSRKGGRGVLAKSDFPKVSFSPFATEKVNANDPPQVSLEEAATISEDEGTQLGGCQGRTVLSTLDYLDHLPLFAPDADGTRSILGTIFPEGEIVVRALDLSNPAHLSNAASLLLSTDIRDRRRGEHTQILLTKKTSIDKHADPFEYAFCCCLYFEDVVFENTSPELLRQILKHAPPPETRGGTASKEVQTLVSLADAFLLSHPQQQQQQQQKNRKERERERERGRQRSTQEKGVMDVGAQGTQQQLSSHHPRRPPLPVPISQPLPHRHQNNAPPIVSAAGSHRASPPSSASSYFSCDSRSASCSPCSTTRGQQRQNLPAFFAAAAAQGERERQDSEGATGGQVNKYVDRRDSMSFPFVPDVVSSFPFLPTLTEEDSLFGAPPFQNDHQERESSQKTSSRTIRGPNRYRSEFSGRSHYLEGLKQGGLEGKPPSRPASPSPGSAAVPKMRANPAVQGIAKALSVAGGMFARSASHGDLLARGERDETDGEKGKERLNRGRVGKPLHLHQESQREVERDEGMRQLVRGPKGEFSSVLTSMPVGDSQRKSGGAHGGRGASGGGRAGDSGRDARQSSSVRRTPSLSGPSGNLTGGEGRAPSQMQGQGNKQNVPGVCRAWAVPACLCIVSAQPFFALFFDALFALLELRKRERQSEVFPVSGRRKREREERKERQVAEMRRRSMQTSKEKTRRGGMESKECSLASSATSLSQNLSESTSVSFLIPEEAKEKPDEIRKSVHLLQPAVETEKEKDDDTGRGHSAALQRLLQLVPDDEEEDENQSLADTEEGISLLSGQTRGRHLQPQQALLPKALVECLMDSEAPVFSGALTVRADSTALRQWISSSPRLSLSGLSLRALREGLDGVRAEEAGAFWFRLNATRAESGKARRGPDLLGFSGRALIERLWLFGTPLEGISVNVPTFSRKAGMLHFRRPVAQETETIIAEWALPVVLSAVPPDLLVTALNFMFLEHKVIVKSESTALVTAMVLALKALIHPLRWCAFGGTCSPLTADECKLRSQSFLVGIRSFELHGSRNVQQGGGDAAFPSSLSSPSPFLSSSSWVWSVGERIGSLQAGGENSGSQFADTQIVVHREPTEIPPLMKHLKSGGDAQLLLKMDPRWVIIDLDSRTIWPGPGAGTEKFPHMDRLRRELQMDMKKLKGLQRQRVVAWLQQYRPKEKNANLKYHAPGGSDLPPPPSVFYPSEDELGVLQQMARKLQTPAVRLAGALDLFVLQLVGLQPRPRRHEVRKLSAASRRLSFDLASVAAAAAAAEATTAAVSPPLASASASQSGVVSSLSIYDSAGLAGSPRGDIEKVKGGGEGGGRASMSLSLFGPPSAVHQEAVSEPNSRRRIPLTGKKKEVDGVHATRRHDQNRFNDFDEREAERQTRKESPIGGDDTSSPHSPRAYSLRSCISEGMTLRRSAVGGGVGRGRGRGHAVPLQYRERQSVAGPSGPWILSGSTPGAADGDDLESAAEGDSDESLAGAASTSDVEEGEGGKGPGRRRKDAEGRGKRHSSTPFAQTSRDKKHEREKAGPAAGPGAAEGNDQFDSQALYSKATQKRWAKFASENLQVRMDTPKAMAFLKVFYLAVMASERLNAQLMQVEEQKAKAREAVATRPPRSSTASRRQTQPPSPKESLRKRQERDRWRDSDRKEEDRRERKGGRRKEAVETDLTDEHLRAKSGEKERGRREDEKNRKGFVESGGRAGLHHPPQRGKKLSLDRHRSDSERKKDDRRADSSRRLPSPSPSPDTLASFNLSVDCLQRNPDYQDAVAVASAPVTPLLIAAPNELQRESNGKKRGTGDRQQRKDREGEIETSHGHRTGARGSEGQRVSTRQIVRHRTSDLFPVSSSPSGRKQSERTSLGHAWEDDRTRRQN